MMPPASSARNHRTFISLGSRKRSVNSYRNHLAKNTNFSQPNFIFQRIFSDLMRSFTWHSTPASNGAARRRQLPGAVGSDGARSGGGSRAATEDARTRSAPDRGIDAVRDSDSRYGVGPSRRSAYGGAGRGGAFVKIRVVERVAQSAGRWCKSRPCKGPCRSIDALQDAGRAFGYAAPSDGNRS